MLSFHMSCCGGFRVGMMGIIGRRFGWSECLRKVVPLPEYMKKENGRTNLGVWQKAWWEKEAFSQSRGCAGTTVCSQR